MHVCVVPFRHRAGASNPLTQDCQNAMATASLERRYTGYCSGCEPYMTAKLSYSYRHHESHYLEFAICGMMSKYRNIR